MARRSNGGPRTPRMGHGPKRPILTRILPTSGANRPGGAMCFERDQRGHLLVLTGVLLVLGFVTLGATLVQLNANEDKAIRTQRDPITDTVNELVDSFSVALRGATQLGNTNITEYMELSSKHEASLNDAAGRIGLYANASLVPDPDLATFLDEEKCVGYDAFASRDGVIIGFEKATLKESIVGAIYRMNFTDGRQMISMEHYIKIYDCTPQYLYTFPTGVTETMGDASDLKPARDPDDERKNVTLREELTGSQTHDEVALVENIDSLAWNTPTEIILYDGFAKRPSPEVVDFLKFDFEPTQQMKDVKAVWGDVVLNDFAINVVARNEPGALSGDDDYLRLSAYKANNPLIPYWMHNFTSLTDEWQNFTVRPPAPSDAPEWTFDEFNLTRFEFTLQMEGLKDTDNPLHVKWTGADIEFAGPSGYQMEIEMQWEHIPVHLYGDHVLEIQYRVPSTSSEELQLQMWNEALDQWQTVGPPLPTTGTAWVDGWSHSVAAPLYENIEYRNKSVLRIVDTNAMDLSKGDRDMIYIDYIAIRSMFTGNPP